MDDENTVGWLNSLLAPKEPLLRMLTPLATYASLAVMALMVVSGWILLAWNLFCPLFRLPAMNWTEAIGVSMLLGLVVLLVYLLKENK